MWRSRRCSLSPLAGRAEGRRPDAIGLPMRGRVGSSQLAHDLDEWGRHMPAYWVARSRIIDPVEYKKYTDRIPAIFAKYRGRVLARGGRFQIMEATNSH
jgi:hypothetical protein